MADIIAIADRGTRRASEAPQERAAYAITLAVADFYVAMQQAQTVNDALTVHAVIASVLPALLAAEAAALRKADALCASPSTCVVSAADYTRYFKSEGEA